METTLRLLPEKVRTKFYFTNCSRCYFWTTELEGNTDLPYNLHRFYSYIQLFYDRVLSLGDIYYPNSEPEEFEKIVSIVSSIWSEYECILDAYSALSDKELEDNFYDLQDEIFWVQEDIQYFVSHFEYADMFFTPEQIDQINSWKHRT